MGPLNKTLRRRLAWASCTLLLVGCAVHKPTSTPTALDPEPIGVDALPRDSTTAALHRQVDSAVVEPHRTLLGKLLSRTPTRTIRVIPVLPVSELVSVGRKSTVSIYYGPATVTNTSAAKKAQVAAGPGAVLTSIEKPRAAVAAAPGAVVQDYTKQGQRGGAAASGAGATATATTSKGFPWWLLLIPAVGYAAYRVNKRFTIF